MVADAPKAVVNDFAEDFLTDKPFDLLRHLRGKPQFHQGGQGAETKKNTIVCCDCREQFRHGSCVTDGAQVLGRGGGNVRIRVIEGAKQCRDKLRDSDTPHHVNNKLTYAGVGVGGERLQLSGRLRAKHDNRLSGGISQPSIAFITQQFQKRCNKIFGRLRRHKDIDRFLAHPPTVIPHGGKDEFTHFAQIFAAQGIDDGTAQFFVRRFESATYIFPIIHVMTPVEHQRDETGNQCQGS